MSAELIGGTGLCPVTLAFACAAAAFHALLLLAAVLNLVCVRKCLVAPVTTSAGAARAIVKFFFPIGRNCHRDAWQHDFFP